MNGFLDKLRHSESFYPYGKWTMREIPFYLLSFEEGIPYLSVVNKDLQPIYPNYRYIRSRSTALLKRIEEIERRESRMIAWDEHPDRYSLKDYPDLCDLMLLSDNLINERGEPVLLSSETVELRINLLHRNRQYVPQLEARIEDTGSYDIRFITSNIILLDGEILHFIPSIGDEYEQLSFFLDPFAEELLMKYLSLFYTYIRNVKITCENRIIRLAKELERAVPTILFRRVGHDLSLHLQLLQVAGSFDVDFQLQFEPQYSVMDSPTHEIVIRKILYDNESRMVEEIRKKLFHFVNNKRTERDFYQEGNFFIVPFVVASPFLLEHLPTLLREYQVLGTEKLVRYKIMLSTPKLRVKASWNVDYLEGNVSVQFGRHRVTLEELLAQYRTNRFVQLSNGNRVVLDRRYVSKLERIFMPDKSDKRKRHFSFFDLPEVIELSGDRFNGEDCVSQREFYEGLNRLPEQTLELPAMKATLRSYQLEGVKWLKYLHDKNLGGCLADDMGLGKTIQTIALLTLLYPGVKKPTLIVMPASLLFNWENEFRKFAPHLDLYIYYGSQRKLEEIPTHQIILSTYSVVRQDIERIRSIHFHYVILDESQWIKNIVSLTTQAIFRLKTDHKLALSGTPIENGLKELYTLFHFLNPNMLGTSKEFYMRYILPIQKNNDIDMLRILHKKIYPFMLRRLKEDVLTELPDLIEQTLFVEMNEEQRLIYERRRSYYQMEVFKSISGKKVQLAQFLMFQAIHELRQIASLPRKEDGEVIDTPKLELLMDALVESVRNGHKTVVFFNFLVGVERVGQRLKKMNIGYEQMIGITSNRRRVIETFQNDRQCMVLLMTLKTGGVGLNLTVADTVFIFEPWWNSSAEAQAIDRLHRFGQTAKVLSYKLITLGSMEEKLLKLQERKDRLLFGLLKNDEDISKYLTTEDIEYILS